MSQVPFEDLMEHIDSKYRLVIVAAKRAKQLNRGAASLIQPRSQKPTYQALEEVAAGKLGYEIEALAGETTRELTEAEERLEEEEAAVEAPVAGAPAEDLIINEFEEESLEELGEIDVIEREEAEE